MDTLLEGFPVSMNGFNFDRGSVSSCSNQNLVDGFNLNHDFIDHHHPPFLQPNTHPSGNFDSSSDGESPESSDYSNAVLKYINEILMEEDLEGKTCMLQDSLALQAAEKSFYDVLGQKYPPPINHVLPSFNQNIENPDDYFTRSSSIDSCDCNYTSNNSVDSLESKLLAPNLYSDIQSFNQFSGGLGEASGSLSNGESVTFSPKSSPPQGLEEVVAISVTDGRDHSSYGSRGRKNDQREDSDDLEEGRSNKHSALSREDFEHPGMFDEVLLCNSENHESESCSLGKESSNGSNSKLQRNGQLKKSNGRTTRMKKKGKRSEVVDLWTLLTQCAQAVSSNDQRTANELLKQIRQHSSAFGDGNQRLAHYFADGLEARLVGTQTPIFLHSCMTASAADVLKAYRVNVSSSPFTRMSFLMANRTIAKLADKTTRLHIIDFGICYGFQWPCLIQLLSTRPAGPPMLRITGIDLPQPGFRPTERVEETGRRLKFYCERFNVPFEYNAIAQKWETIQLEDLKIDRDEVTVVNSLYRMRNLPDDTVMDSSPRDDVLTLIKRINPDIFIHGVLNGTHNAPFFLTRFREALFHFSALFDMYDVNVPNEEEGRMLYEREVIARDAINTIACEGTERVERPETYRQWQVRNHRAGFRKLPLDEEILKKVRTIVKSYYHQDFVVDEDGHWMLQGWKGRVIHALSFWKPVQK